MELNFTDTTELVFDDVSLDKFFKMISSIYDQPYDPCTTVSYAFGTNRVVCRLRGSVLTRFVVAFFQTQ
jgi:hypothetical protein